MKINKIYETLARIKTTQNKLTNWRDSKAKYVLGQSVEHPWVPFWMSIVIFIIGALMLLSKASDGMRALVMSVGLALWFLSVGSISSLVFGKPVSRKHKVSLNKICLFLGFLFVFWISTSLMAGWVNGLTNEISTEQPPATDSVSFSDMITILLTLVLSPIGEEFFFRKWCFGYTTGITGKPIPAMILSSLVFAFAHQTLVHLMPCFLLGVLCCLVYYYTGNIWMSIGTHIIYNLFSTVLSFDIGWDFLGSAVGVILQFCIFALLFVILMVKWSYDNLTNSSEQNPTEQSETNSEIKEG